MATRPVNSFLVLKSLEWPAVWIKRRFWRISRGSRNTKVLFHADTGRSKDFESLSLISVTEGSATCAMRDMQGTQRSHCRHLLLGTSDGSALISECPSTERFLGYAYRCKFVFVFGVFVICLPPSVSWCMPECLQLYCQCVYVMFFPESAKTTCISSYDIEPVLHSLNRSNIKLCGDISKKLFLN